MSLLKGTTYYQLWTPDATFGVPVARITGTHTYIFWHNDQPRYSGTPSTHARTGIYLIAIPLTGFNFVTGSTYGLTTLGAASGYLNNHNFDNFQVGAYTEQSLTGMTANTYYADVNLHKNDISGADYYSVFWTKNSILETGINNLTFTIYDYTGGIKIPNSSFTIMTGENFRFGAARTSGIYRLATGERYFGEFFATIDGTQRMWREPLFRDLST